MEQSKIIRRSEAEQLGLAFLAFLLAIFAARSVMSVVLPPLFPELIRSEWYPWLFSSLPVYLVALPVCLLLLRPVPPISPRPDRPLRLPHTLFALMICFGAMLIGNLLGRLLMQGVGLLTGEPPANPLDTLLFEINPLISAIFTVIVAPIGEEFIFRRLLIDRARQYGDLQAVLLSGALFGAFHMNFYQFFYAFLLGVIFGYIYLKTGRLRYTILLHAAINLVGGMLASMLLRILTPILSSPEVLISDPEALTPYLLPLLVYLLYSALLSGCALATLILGILLRRKITLSPANTPARPLWLSFGMIAFFVLCIGKAAMGML